jgi:hypothetical protein
MERKPASGPHRRSRGRSTSQAIGTLSPIVTPALFAITAGPNDRRVDPAASPPAQGGSASSRSHVGSGKDVIHAAPVSRVRLAARSSQRKPEEMPQALPFPCSQHAQCPGIEFRFHKTTLYNSIFRFDGEMIVNMHVYGVPGAHAPALHLRKLGAGDLFDTYAKSFVDVWALSKPATW